MKNSRLSVIALIMAVLGFTSMMVDILYDIVIDTPDTTVGTLSPENGELNPNIIVDQPIK